MADRILISEIYGPTIHGDGALAGRPTVFVRTGCNGLDAVQGNYEELDAGEIMRRVWKRTKNTPCLIHLAGPAASQPVAGLIDLAHYGYGCTVSMESTGLDPRPWFKTLDHLVLAPAPPSSGQVFSPELLNACIDATVAGKPLSRLRTNTSMRLVVMDSADYDFARRVWLTCARPLGIPFFIAPRSVGASHVLQATKWLIEKVASDRWYDVTVIPPLDALLWELAA